MCHRLKGEAVFRRRRRKRPQPHVDPDPYEPSVPPIGPPPMGYCPLTISVGPLLLGALAPADRDQFQAHLAVCPKCRDELVQLAGLPGLLARLALPERRRPAS